MTSHDAFVPGPGAAAGRRRALGRGPGRPPADAEPEAEPEPAVPEPAAAEPTAAETVLEPVATETAPEAVAADAAAPELETRSEAIARATADAESETGREPLAADAATPESETGSQAVAFDAAGLDRETGRETVALEAAAPPGGAVVGGAASAAEGPSDGVFKVRLANFEGPFDLLLQLISKHKLDVTEVALSKVTDEFMAHIRAMGPDWDLDQTTEFLVVAATLLDLKAARLLPAAEVEDEADLALLEARDLLFARLLQYRAYKQIADIFTHRLESEGRRYPRTVGLEPHHAELLPEVVISIGAQGFAGLAVKAMQPRAKPQVYVDHIHAPLVSVQEQAQIVVARLRELGEASFRALVADTDDTLTVVARFLALLELYREKAVALDQETALGELLVRWTGGDGNAQPRVTDEFDRPPEEPGKETKT
ncbi:segregation/condensation protein A [Streptomyces sp. ME08-AFT2]|uniref:segregation and condensation protein A n=1 Tax=Streptomyces sp. ME08-AFT2 TaxID=3028683 RepID=UPI0029B950A4|nr:segregation/condensation protein A [Streptomyces sp. ME08-AFT2]MDX3309567.1 segregation/condensation protein A [Streptomyces sp. ME08-AFT2]